MFDGFFARKRKISKKRLDKRKTALQTSRVCRGGVAQCRGGIAECRGGVAQCRGGVAECPANVAENPFTPGNVSIQVFAHFGPFIAKLIFFRKCFVYIADFTINLRSGLKALALFLAESPNFAIKKTSLRDRDCD